MTTIGTAVLQIIPSLKGVSDAIEKQIDGKVVEVKIAPKVDKAATKKAGKDAGDTIVKEAKDVVNKGEIGKAIADDVKTSVKKSNAGTEIAKVVTADVKKASPGKDIAKVIVEGLADGVKQGLPAGSFGGAIVDGLTDQVNKGIENSGLGTQVVGSITRVIKSGNLAGAIKDAVLPGITDIGTNIRAGASQWSHDIAASLRSGDITGAAGDIAATVTKTTDIISGIGDVFGLETDSFKSGSDTAVGYISNIGGSLQGVIDKGGEVSSKISDSIGQFKTLGDTAATLAGKDFASKGTKFGDSLAAVSAAAGPIGLTLAAADGIDKVLTNLNLDKFTEVPGSALWFLHQLNSDWSGIKNLTNAVTSIDTGIPKGPLPTGGTPVLPGILSKNPPPSASPFDPNPLPFLQLPKKVSGGQISGPGTGTSDSILAWVSNKEFIVNAAATQKSLPLLEMINSGKLPGFSGGGLVAGDQQLRKIIMDRFGISDIGGYRPADKYGEHSTGRALDVMVGNNRAKGDAVKDFALANASAIDLKWAIWRQHLYYPGGGGYDMPDRGSPTQNHMDHVHIFSGPGIVNGLRGALAGVGPGAGIAAGIGVPGAGAAAPGGPGAEDTSSADQTASAASSSGGGVSLPSSISGFATLPFDAMTATGKANSGPGHRDPAAYFPSAASAAVGGQIQSALGLFGVNDAPPFLKAASQLISGIKVSEKGTGKPIFDGANPLGSFSRGSAAPLSATSSGTGAPPPDNAGNVHGTRAGQPAGPVFHTTIQARDAEGALDQWRRWQNERVAAKTDSLGR